jgi:hypothetical protein
MKRLAIGWPFLILNFHIGTEQMLKSLKIWNGRGLSYRKRGDSKWDNIPSNGSANIYAAAYSRADLRRMLFEYSGVAASNNEIRDYWNEGSWGLPMEGIAVERGLWLKNGYGDEKPVRIF